MNSAQQLSRVDETPTGQGNLCITGISPLRPTMGTRAMRAVTLRNVDPATNVTGAPPRAGGSASSAPRGPVRHLAAGRLRRAHRALVLVSPGLGGGSIAEFAFVVHELSRRAPRGLYTDRPEHPRSADLRQTSAGRSTTSICPAEGRDARLPVRRALRTLALPRLRVATPGRDRRGPGGRALLRGIRLPDRHQWNAGQDPGRRGCDQHGGRGLGVGAPATPPSSSVRRSTPRGTGR